MAATATAGTSSTTRFDAVLSAISTGQPVTRACARAGVTRLQFYRALDRDAELASKYADAMRAQVSARFGAAINCTNGD